MIFGRDDPILLANPALETTPVVHSGDLPGCRQDRLKFVCSSVHAVMFSCYYIWT
jgi:hypothetical protein